MAILDEVQYTKPPDPSSMYAGTSIQEVDGIPDSEYKALSPSETVVPRTTISGGIRGSDKVYPPVKYRKFQGSTQQEERVIKDAKRIGIEEPSAEPAKAEADKDIEEVKTMIKKAKQAAEQEEAISDMPPAMAAMMETFLTQIAKHNMKQTQEAKSEEKPPTPLTTVKFKGAFGQIDAPYKQVIKGSKCIALVPPEGGTVQYEPPVNTDAVLDITVNGVMYRVVNAGITFNIPGIGKVVILLLAPDLQPGT